MKIQLLIFVTIIAFFSCQNNTTKDEVNQVVTTPTSPPLTINPFDTLPVFPQAKAEVLFQKLETVSINFLNGFNPITIYGETQSRQMIAGLITLQKPNNPICQSPLATFSFSGKGEVLGQGSMFFQQGCTYLIFQDLQTSQYTYISQMGNKGINSLNQILQSQAAK